MGVGYFRGGLLFAIRKHRAVQHAPYSPYFLPTDELMEPARDKFMPGCDQHGELNKWWAESPELEKRFRARLLEAKSQEFRFPDLREPDAYTQGYGKGRGGAHSKNVRRREKRHNYRQQRPY